jgi:hypothetical protein
MALLTTFTHPELFVSGQVLWLKELKTYQTSPSLQAPGSYNLSQVYKQIKNNARVIVHSVTRA